MEELIQDSVLLSMEDRDLVPDCLFVAMAQMDISRVSQADRVGCYKEREIGFKVCFLLVYGLCTTRIL